MTDSGPPPGGLPPGCHWVKVTPKNVDRIVAARVKEEMDKLVDQMIEKGMTGAERAAGLRALRPFFHQFARDLKLSLLAPRSERPN